MSIINKINNREAKVGVIGLGYVGLPLVIEFYKAGFSVTGFDVDYEKVTMLQQGKSYIKHIDVSTLFSDEAFGTPNDKPSCRSFTATTDFSKLTDMDCIIICVPTPLNKYREPDMSYVFNTVRTIAQYLRKEQLISLESTTYPGTTDEHMRAILEATGLKAGIDFHLAFSPEREDPNNKEFSTSTIPKVVGGYTKECLAAAVALYNTVVNVIDLSRACE